ncbi:239_t:CDS:2 [Scutellospora calospora]|uniref:239_t:CDS:1 n=1 Tax=Scutellospora calospora TaxID=85575 RepID=A0ACA9MYQ6_9GLOM|nr:239_t:CDS:2 [Scutellospora calospora]
MFSPKTTKQINKLEVSLKKILENLKKEKEYIFDRKDETESERIIIDQEIDETLQIVRYELQPEIEKRIEQETLKRLKRRYPDQIQKINKRSKVEPKVIILTGGIGVGKTTFGEKFAEYLENKGFKVYRPVETSLKIKPELDLFYKDVKNRALFFQHVILQTYKKEVEKINQLIGYDYVIFDRTHIDTEVFTHLNIEEQDALDYLEEKRSKIDLKNIHKVLYIKPKIENMLKRQEIRNRKGETTDIKYLTKLYQEYNSRITNMYPEHIKFENDCSNEEDHKPAECCFKEYESIELSSNELFSDEYEKIESELYDQLQDHFYEGSIDNETIINTVLDFIKSNPTKYRFDINWWSVINDLKPQYELEVKDEVYRRTNMRNPDVKNKENFKLIEEEVHDAMLDYSSILEYYYTDEDLRKYEESDNFKYIVNRETMRLYRDSERQRKILQDIKIE